MSENKENTKVKFRKIVLSANREILSFIIVERNIYYGGDRKIKAMIRCLPKPKNFIQVINKSRNRIPMFLNNLFNLSKDEMAEYDGAQTVDELAEIIIRDAKKNGCILVGNGDIFADEDLIKKIKEQEVII